MLVVVVVRLFSVVGLPTASNIGTFPRPFAADDSVDELVDTPIGYIAHGRVNNFVVILVHLFVCRFGILIPVTGTASVGSDPLHYFTDLAAFEPGVLERLADRHALFDVDSSLREAHDGRLARCLTLGHGCLDPLSHSICKRSGFSESLDVVDLFFGEQARVDSGGEASVDLL